MCGGFAFLSLEIHVITKNILLTLAALAVAGPVMAADCSTEIEGNDAMQFNKKVIEVSKSCKEFTVKLKHAGKMPKTAMGHNWVLSKAADINAIGTDGIPAGIAANYIKAGDTRVIAHTKVIGGGETDSVTFPISALKDGETYAFFCSFPGHWSVMKGDLKLVN